MKLRSVRIRKFKNILDSSAVDIDTSVTCLVGKNESGKTAFLNALYRLNPARANVKFGVHEQYPAWLEKRDRLKGDNLDEVQPVTAEFDLDAEDVAKLEEEFGAGVVSSNNITLSRNYGGTLYYTLGVSETAFVQHVVDLVDWPRGTKTEANKSKTIDDLRNYSAALKAEPGEGEDRLNASRAITAALDKTVGELPLREAIWDAVKVRMPKFMYFSEYSTLPYSVAIQKLLTADPSTLTDTELTARALLKLAAAEHEYLVNPDYERRKRELENVANALTQDVLQYWTQNPDLRVQPDITQKTVSDNRGQQSVLDELKIRIWDQRHQLSLPFTEHSTGFRWFFSFLAAFSEFEYTNDPVVILLDEPALGLHARAQRDFLRFIDERLAPRCQVLYSTHSPFMVEAGRLERVRLVEDKGQAEGTVVSADFTSTDSDTLFPLQGALGYDLAQNLFVGSHNLVMEGTSDFTYLTAVSSYLRAEGESPGLDDRWTVVPVGGVDLVPTFVALLGNHLEVTVLIDAQRGGHQRLSRLVAQGIIQDRRVITIGQILGLPEADIEDLFTPSEYLELYNSAFKSSLSEDQLTGADPIVKRIARAVGRDRFDHGVPADWFLRNRDVFLPKLSAETKARFAKLFEEVNTTLGLD